MSEVLHLQISLLKLQKGTTEPKLYHILTPCPMACNDNPKDIWKAVYTVAFLKGDKEGYSMETVGHRPWEISGISGQEFMDFCKIAIQLLEKLDKENQNA